MTKPFQFFTADDGVENANFVRVISIDRANQLLNERGKRVVVPADCDGHVNEALLIAERKIHAE